MPNDRDGNEVFVGSLVRVLKLSGQWLDDLPNDERVRVLSIVGEILRVHEIDEHGRPWVKKEWWETAESCNIHDVALDADEMLIVVDSD